MLAASGNEVYSVMVQIQHEKEVQLRQDSDDNRRSKAYSMFTVLGGVTQSFMILAFSRQQPGFGCESAVLDQNLLQVPRLALELLALAHRLPSLILFIMDI